MSEQQAVTVQGTVSEDGSLQLPGKLTLPPGQVEVTIRSLEPTKEGEGIMEALKRIRASQAARGYVPRSAEEVHAQLEQSRAEWDEHDAEIEAIQEQARLAREKNAGGRP